MSESAILPSLADGLSPPPKMSAGMAPQRVSGSIRRTSTIDVDWPEGRSGPMRLLARARDIHKLSGSSIVLAEDSFEAILAPDRTITSIVSQLGGPQLKAMIGQRAGSRLRSVIDAALPSGRSEGTPLYLILDDIAGASLVAPWAWSRWDPNWLADMEKIKADPKDASLFDRENVCAGLRTGSSGLSFAADGVTTTNLRNPDDLKGWHDFTRQDGVGFRRARRIDVQLDTFVRVDAAFQDSATTPAGTRSVVHEYRVMAAADPVSLKLVELAAEPRVLPFAECPAAAANVSRLLGQPMSSLRETVLQELRGIAGCTHLNDALRALAEVPVLARLMQHAGNAAAH